MTDEVMNKITYLVMSQSGRKSIADFINGDISISLKFDKYVERMAKLSSFS